MAVQPVTSPQRRIERWAAAVHANWTATHSPPGRARPRNYGVVITLWLILAALVALFFVGMARGYSYFDVTTPSMGEAAPVGTLIVTRPETIANVNVGELVTLRPGPGSRTYTHRVVKNTPQGLTTKGDINGATDPWTVTQDTLVGVVEHRIWGGGWAVRGAPWLMLGWFLVAVLTRMFVGLKLRPGTRLVGASVVFTCVTLWLQPWVRAMILGHEPKASGINANIIATGVLPITVEAKAGGASIDLVAGQRDTLFSEFPNAKGIHEFLPQAHLTGWWLFAVTTFILSPVVYSLVVGWRREIRERAFRKRLRHLARDERARNLRQDSHLPLVVPVYGPSDVPLFRDAAGQPSFTPPLTSNPPQGAAAAPREESLRRRVIRIT